MDLRVSGGGGGGGEFDVVEGLGFAGVGEEVFGDEVCRPA